MLFRLLIGIILALVIYRGLKSWLSPNSAKQQPVSGQQGGHIEDDMVQDPQCGIYFPRRQGVALRRQGQDLLFCSQECKEAYEKNYQK